MKHANSILETFEYFCQKLSKLNSIILSYTVSNLVHFLRHSVDAVLIRRGGFSVRNVCLVTRSPPGPLTPLTLRLVAHLSSFQPLWQLPSSRPTHVTKSVNSHAAGGFTYRLSFNERKDYI